MSAGRPQKAESGSVYAFAHQFYWSFRRLADGSVRWRLDEKKYKGLIEGLDDARSLVRRDWHLRQAAIEAQKEIKLPGEPDVIKVLLNPNTTPEQIREVCKDAVMLRQISIGSEKRVVEVSAWPIPSGDPFPTYLAQFAEQYIEALSDPRFPRSDRPSSRLKQFWFLSRALAGALYGVSPRTSINLVGSMRPEEVFDQSRQARPGRKKRKPNRITNRKR